LFFIDEAISLDFSRNGIIYLIILNFIRNLIK